MSFIESVEIDVLGTSLELQNVMCFARSWVFFQTILWKYRSYFLFFPLYVYHV